MDPTSYERTGKAGGVRAATKGGSILDWDSGRFGMILATEGEANDGHILSVKGAQLPERMPLLVQHTPTPMLPALGSVIEMKAARKKVAAVGLVELQGASDAGARADEGVAIPDALLPIRNGYAHMIAAGHLDAVSVRWEGTGVPRASLKPTHPAYIDTSDSDLAYEKRYGLFFSEWFPREGSVVAVGSDPLAIIRERAAEDGIGPVERLYWGSLIRAHEEDADTPDILEASALISQGASLLRDAGLEPRDLELMLVNFGGLDGSALDCDLVPVTVDGRTWHIPRDCYDTLRGESLEAYREAISLRTGHAPEPPRREPEPPKPEGNRAPIETNNDRTLALSENEVTTLARGIAGPVSGALEASLRRIR